jgi:excisionase family DNA binding protein
MPDLLTTNDIAAKLRLKPTTIREWVRQGRIPEIKLSRKVRRFDLGEVLAALKAPRREAAHAE